MPRTKSEEKMILLSFHLQKKMLDDLDELVRSGAFSSRSEAIRVAIRDLINREKGDYSSQLMEGR
jgi:Arc/MetJ-type ribon-helix-helix transcriptional regulator